MRSLLSMGSFRSDMVLLCIQVWGERGCNSVGVVTQDSCEEEEKKRRREEEKERR
jgi:hypothetical protein